MAGMVCSYQTVTHSFKSFREQFIHVYPASDTAQRTGNIAQDKFLFFNFFPDPLTFLKSVHVCVYVHVHTCTCMCVEQFRFIA